MDPRYASLNEVEHRLFIGNAASTHSRVALQENQIGAVLSLVVGPVALWRNPKFTDYVAKGRHLWIECLDSSTQDLLKHMSEACDFIATMLTTPPPHPYPPPGYYESSLDLSNGSGRTATSSEEECSQGTDSHESCRSHGPVAGGSKVEDSNQLVHVGRRGVLVHCEQGISRSGTILIAYLMRTHRRPLQQVLADVRAKRPRVKPNENFMEQLEIWRETDYNIWEDEDQTIPKLPYARYLERRAVRLKAKGLTGNEPMHPSVFDGEI